MGLDLEDRSFLRAVHEGSVESFRHKDHLRLAWTVLRFHSFDEAKNLASGGIREYAASKGASGLSHETLTEFWVRMVQHAMITSPQEEFDRLLRKYPILLDKNIPYRHWTRERLASPEARTGWVAPDILAIPF